MHPQKISLLVTCLQLLHSFMPYHLGFIGGHLIEFCKHVKKSEFQETLHSPWNKDLITGLFMCLCCLLINYLGHIMPILTSLLTALFVLLYVSFIFFLITYCAGVCLNLFNAFFCVVVLLRKRYLNREKEKKLAMGGDKSEVYDRRKQWG